MDGRMKEEKYRTTLQSAKLMPLKYLSSRRFDSSRMCELIDLRLGSELADRDPEFDRYDFPHLWNGKPFISNVEEVLPDNYILSQEPPQLIKLPPVNKQLVYGWRWPKSWPQGLPKQPLPKGDQFRDPADACPSCGSFQFYTKVRGPHEGKYCRNCNRWIQWVKQ